MLHLWQTPNKCRRWFAVLYQCSVSIGFIQFTGLFVCWLLLFVIIFFFSPRACLNVSTNLSGCLSSLHRPCPPSFSFCLFLMCLLPCSREKLNIFLVTTLLSVLTVSHLVKLNQFDYLFQCCSRKLIGLLCNCLTLIFSSCFLCGTHVFLFLSVQYFIHHCHELQMITNFGIASVSSLKDSIHPSCSENI